jgi:hypothetical protein
LLGAGSVTEGDGVGAFAAAEEDVLGVGDAEFDGEAGGGDMGAVAEGLFAGAAAGAPVVGAGGEFAGEGWRGAGLGERLIGHGCHLGERV